MNQSTRNAHRLARFAARRSGADSHGALNALAIASVVKTPASNGSRGNRSGSASARCCRSRWPWAATAHATPPA